VSCGIGDRLNATEYGDLKDKLRSPVMNIRNVIIRQTLSERFLEAFRFHVDQNEVYRKPPDTVINADVGLAPIPEDSYSSDSMTIFLSSLKVHLHPVSFSSVE